MIFTPRAKGLGRDNFIKLRDREQITGVFKGEIYKFKRHWSNNQGVECLGAQCPICQADPDNYANYRFRVNFVTTVDGNYVAKIFEGGGELYDLLVSLDTEYDFSKSVVKITRRGLNQNTKYDILPIVNSTISPEMAKRINEVELLALTTVKHELGVS